MYSTSTVQCRFLGRTEYTPHDILAQYRVDARLQFSGMAHSESPLVRMARGSVRAGARHR